MPTTDPERARRGKNLVLYGMFSLILITFLSSFLVLAVIMRKIDPAFFDGAAIAGMALVPSLIVTAIAIVACIAGWIVYTKVILKE
ncbi:MAG: hypothetical protein AMJ93_13245 [Anaerolineae bacterium SM23_84]|jgi:hypothetical protein|nr:MAG: hypothetical protein AMJ93_13245 [Anaerolineae bacterium SM23_84]